VPNLNTDRGFWVIGFRLGGNVRRLMYQSLIWSAVLRNQPRSLRAALDAKDLKGLADTLVDGVRRDLELCRDFFRAEMLVDEAQAVELTATELGDSRRQLRRTIIVLGPTSFLVRAVHIVQSYSHPAQHAATPEPSQARTLGHLLTFSHIREGFTP
jgi:hypothetical protein